MIAETLRHWPDASGIDGGYEGHARSHVLRWVSCRLDKEVIERCRG